MVRLMPVKVNKTVFMDKHAEALDYVAFGSKFGNRQRFTASVSWVEALRRHWGSDFSVYMCV